MWYFLIAIISIILIVYFKLYNSKKFDLNGKHVFITGGSKGIGRSLAEIAVESGANVSIVARDYDALEETKMDLLKKCINTGKQKVFVQSVDVSGDFMDIEKAITEAESVSGPVYLLICSAGTSISQRFEDTSINSFKTMMNVNYFGTVNTIKAALPSMKNNEKGHIILFSSIAGLFGLYGYSAYSASKFAITGLAQALSMELQQHNIKVTVSFPPDTDTPGFAEEQKSKPIETKLISESGGLFSSHAVASRTLQDAMLGKFASTIGFESWMVKTVCCGMMPFTSAYEVITQVMTMGLLRLAVVLYHEKWKKIIQACASERQSNKKSD